MRQALNLAIDREALSQVVFSGAMPPAGQAFPPDSLYYDPAFPAPARDIEKAKALLTEAGVQTPVKIAVQTPNTPVQMQMMQLVQAMAAEAGFDLGGRSPDRRAARAGRAAARCCDAAADAGLCGGALK